MVQDDGDDMLVRAEPEHLAAQREFGGEVEGAALGGLDQRGQLVLGAVEDRAGHGHVLGRDDPLVRLALVRREDRSQSLVAAGDIAQGGGQGLGVEGAVQAEDQREVVGDAAAGDLLDEQQPSLGGRQRDAVGPFGDRGDRRAGRARLVGAAREQRRGGGLEEVADGEFGAQLRAGAADQAGGKE